MSFQMTDPNLEDLERKEPLERRHRFRNRAGSVDANHYGDYVVVYAECTSTEMSVWWHSAGGELTRELLVEFMSVEMTYNLIRSGTLEQE